MKDYFWKFILDHLDKSWDWNNLSINPMDAPYYKSEHHCKKLAKRLLDTVWYDFIAIAIHPNIFS